MKAYYSIDVDFWTEKSFSALFFERIAAAGKPMIIVHHHQELLPHTQRFKFDALINLDFHSDVVFRSWKTKAGRRPRCPLNCGNWISFAGSPEKQFIWSYPQNVCYDPENGSGTGTCHANEPSPFLSEDAEGDVGFRSVTARQLWYPRLCDVVAIGIAMSPHWAEETVTNRFLDVVERTPALYKAANRNIQHYADSVSRNIDYEDDGG